MQVDSPEERAARLAQLRQQRLAQPQLPIRPPNASHTAHYAQSIQKDRENSSSVIESGPLQAGSRPSPLRPRPQKLYEVFIRWLYRTWLLGATIGLTYLLIKIQSVLDHVHMQASIWRSGVRWLELTWLAPVPLAIFLWLGWFIFAEAVRARPEPVAIPSVFQRSGLFAFAPTRRPVRLIFRFVTRGDNIDVLRDSVIAVHNAFTRYPYPAGPYFIEIISECAINLKMGVDPHTRIYVVPPGYVTPNRSRFKARALTYLQNESQKYSPTQAEDWYIYLDEESLVDEHMLAGLYRFVSRAIEFEARKQKDGQKDHHQGLIGQGAILYQGGNWFFRGADALRTADDLGRFRLQYALGRPMFGIHGSFIVVRGLDDKQLSFDVGKANSITEDAAWALRAWAQGYRFAWVDGYLHEQPPQRVKDFVRQRSRWLSGIRAVLRDKQVPFMYRLCLGIFTVLWQLAFLPLLVALVALFVHASPFRWMRIPADFAWATFTLAYLQGIDVQAKSPHPFLKKGRVEAFLKRAISWPLVLCSFWFALLEALGVLYSLQSKQGFFVISKPSLAREENGHKMSLPAPARAEPFLPGLAAPWQQQLSPTLSEDAYAIRGSSIAQYRLPAQKAPGQSLLRRQDPRAREEKKNNVIPASFEEIWSGGGGRGQ
ncbi:MAG TPA: glycosyltransferase family 2 protein [Ktedonobacteraceae bacterium]|nr:glycosyltransferase family 2 protein [Ktedonobacteraceae bacterium]